ncbi:MAG: hypothetical protein HY096_07860 [Nitrospinae bacterium]|nr:hypothetical protein [Nitrospinota bacterium]
MVTKTNNDEKPITRFIVEDFVNFAKSKPFNATIPLKLADKKSIKQSGINKNNLS